VRRFEWQCALDLALAAILRKCVELSDCVRSSESGLEYSSASVCSATPDRENFHFLLYLNAACVVEISSSGPADGALPRDFGRPRPVVVSVQPTISLRTSALSRYALYVAEA
jgi:hypothetical protein